MIPSETPSQAESSFRSAERISETEQLIEINQISSDIFNRVPLKGHDGLANRLAPAERAWIDDLKLMSTMRLKVRDARVALKGNWVVDEEVGLDEHGQTRHKRLPLEASEADPIQTKLTGLEAQAELTRDRAIAFFIDNYFYFFEEVEHYFEEPLTTEQRQELAGMMVDTIARLMQVRTDINQLRITLDRVLGVIDRFKGGDSEQRTSRHTFLAATNGRSDTDQNIASFMAGRVVNKIVEMKKIAAGEKAPILRQYGEALPEYPAPDAGQPLVADELLYAARPLSEKTGTGSPVLHQLEAERQQAQLNESIAFLSPERRKQHLRSWLSERFRERPKIAGTAFDRRVIRDISRSREIMNGLAGVILFGPPGTGKTQFLIEANHQDGFETRVISIHKYTDMVQLLGEPEIQVSMGQGASPFERLRSLAQDPVAFQAWLVEMKTSRPKTYARVAEFVRSHSPNPDQAINDDDIATEFIRTVKDMELSEALSASEGITKEQAWLKGEILRAIQNKERVVLDEIEKTQLGGLDSISNFLALKPGDTIKLGSESIQIPHWFRVDATANALTLPEHLKNRFSSTIKLDYPPAADMLQKVALWLTNDNGDIPLSKEDQAKLVGVFTYLVPRIQELYAQLLEERAKAEADPRTTVLPPVLSPLSLRNLAVFCQQVLNRRMSVNEAIKTQFLTPGQLSQGADSAWERLVEVVADYQSFISFAKPYRPRDGAEPLLDAVANSPLFAELPTIQVDAAQRDTIPELKELPLEEKPNEDNEMMLSNGWMLAVNDQGLSIIGGGATLWRSDLEGIDVDVQQLQLLDSSDDGRAVIIKANANRFCLVTPFTTQPIRELTGGRDWISSPDSRVVAGIYDRKIKLVFVVGGKETVIKLPDDVPLQLQFNLDGSNLLVTGQKGTYNVPVPQAMQLPYEAYGHEVTMPAGRWQYVRNLLVQV